MALKKFLMLFVNGNLMVQILHILLLQIEMGPKQSSSNGGEYSTLLQDYQIVRTLDSEGLFFLKNKQTGSDYLLRQFTFNDKKQYERYVELLQKRKHQLNGCKYVIPLDKIITKVEDQYCSTFYKIYALFEFTERTLENQILQRNGKKKRFQEKELWSILASCIVGLSHLQKHAIKHQALRSSTILISQQGVIKIFDPIATGSQNNYDTLIGKRSTSHIYLSPQLADSLQLQAGQPHAHAYKSDIWTMGMIILQAGLTQYQDECYRDQCSRVHWETIQYNIHRFRQNYSQELAALVQFMLSRQERNRPEWLQLQQRVIKEEQSRMSQVHNMSRDSNVYRQSQKVHAHVDYNKTFDNRFSAKQPTNPHPHLITSNAVPIYQDPNYRKTVQPFNNNPQTSALNRAPLLQNHNRTSSSVSASNQIQFKPSNIEATRPLRNMFPACTYNTITKVDENLIVVNEEDRFSQLDTPSQRNNISYFQSNSRQRNNAAENQIQRPPYQTTFTPTRVAVQENIGIPSNVTTYGVSNFEHQAPVYRPPPVQTQNFLPNQSSGVNSVAPSMQGPPPPPPNLPQSAPQGGEYVVQRYKQGSEYKGFKWQDMRHGFGVFYYQDGGMYEGEWRFNRMQGKGKLYYQSGKLAYEGDWVNDQFQGYGKLFNEYPQIVNQPLNYKNLDDIEQMWTKYQGEFNGDLKSGRGLLFLTNGQYYDGQFKEDYADGQGHYHRMNGEVVQGRWNKNILIE